MEKQTGKDRRMTENKKRIVCGALLCVMALGMTACGNEIPDLTEAESQRVGEYAAVTLLKYDANHRSRLVDPEIVIAKLEKTRPRKPEDRRMHRRKRSLRNRLLQKPRHLPHRRILPPVWRISSDLRRE